MTLLPDLTEPSPQPYDLGQSPADLVVISALPSDIAALSEARAAMQDAPSLRLAHLAHLRHPASVDQHLDSCATRARLVVIRLPEGGDGWSYGLTQYTARCTDAGVPLALLPCEERIAPELQARSTVSDDIYHALRACFSEGGPENALHILNTCAGMTPGAPAHLQPRSGVYWPGTGPCDPDTLRQSWRPERPVAALLFSRALIHGTGLHPVNRMIRALLRAGLNPLPLFTGAQEDEAIAALLDASPPAILLSCLPGSETSALPTGIPIVHAALASCSEAEWIEDANGLPPRDIAEHILLPTCRGELFTRAISTLDEAYFDEATECPILAPRALGDRVEFTTQLASNWVKLTRTPRARRRLAVVQPDDDDAKRITEVLLSPLQNAGYDIIDPPEEMPVHLALQDYEQAYATLPWPLRDAVEQRWGMPQDDPDCAAEIGFRLPVQRCGNIAIARSHGCPAGEPPPHRLIALYHWLRQDFGAQAIVHLGGHGGLGALPGKATALSAECWPEQLLGPLPHIAMLEDDTALARNRLHALCLPSDGAALIDALEGAVPAAAQVPALPTREGWLNGQASAEEWIHDQLQSHGDWPQAVTLSFFAVPTVLLEGANVAHALHLMGLRPGADALTPIEGLTRPPVTVTPRISPCFRRTYPELVTLLNTACKGLSSR